MACDFSRSATRERLRAPKRLVSEANSDERTHRRDDASWTYELTKRTGIFDRGRPPLRPPIVSDAASAVYRCESTRAPKVRKRVRRKSRRCGTFRFRQRGCWWAGRRAQSGDASGVAGRSGKERIATDERDSGAPRRSRAGLRNGFRGSGQRKRTGVKLDYEVGKRNARAERKREKSSVSLRRGRSQGETIWQRVGEEGRRRLLESLAPGAPRRRSSEAYSQPVAKTIERDLVVARRGLQGRTPVDDRFSYYLDLRAHSRPK